MKQVLGEVPDILPGGCEAQIPAREVTNTEVTGDYGKSRTESDDESFHDSISSLELRDGFLSGTEIGDDQRRSRFDSRHQMGTMNVTMKAFTRVRGLSETTGWEGRRQRLCGLQSENLPNLVRQEALIATGSRFIAFPLLSLSS